MIKHLYYKIQSRDSFITPHNLAAVLLKKKMDQKLEAHHVQVGKVQ